MSEPSFILSMGAIFLPSLTAFADLCLDMCAKSVPEKTAASNTAVGAGGTLRFPPPYSVDEYIRRWWSGLDARRCAFLPAGSTLKVMAVRVERETRYAGWWRRWEH